MSRIRLFVLFVWVTAMPSLLWGHGTDYRLISKEAVVAAAFFYADNTPMQYSEILIFSPENDKVEFQNGRTDQNGRFAFVAETPGEWRIKVSDGMGHAVNAALTVNSADSELKTAGGMPGNPSNAVLEEKNPLFGGTPKGVKLVFGLSILLNIFLGVHWWKHKP